MNVAIPIFDHVTALDAVGPYEVLSRLPGTRVCFVASSTGPKRTENGIAKPMMIPRIPPTNEISTASARN